MYHAGLVSISFRSLTPKQIIDTVANAGLACIEWGSDVHAPCHDIPSLQEIARLQKDAGISCCSYGTYFRIGVNTAQELPDYIRAAKILGTNILRLWCGSKGSEEYTPEELTVLYAQCRELAEIAQKEGVTLCMECHNGTITDRADAAFSLMQAVNMPSFRMYYQPNQFRTTEENIYYAKRLAPYTLHLHVFNWKEYDRFPLRDSLPLWREYLSAFSGDRHLLLEFMPDDRVESLPGEAAALLQLIGG